MPIYTLQGPDGRTYKIEGPSGATAEQLGEVIQSQSDKRSQIASQIENDPISRGARNFTDEMSGLQKFVAGYGKAGVDLARGAGQMVGTVSRDDVAESRKLDQPLMRTGAGQVGNLTGNIAQAVPTAMIPGANTMTGAALIGGASGLLQPSTSTSETFKNIGIGGAAGAAVPAIMTTAKTAKSFIDPLYKSGREKIVGRAIADTAATDPRILANALRNTKSAVPGVEYTVAEAAQNPSLAAMQRTASQTTPAVMNEAAARQAANNEARQIALSGLAPDRQAAQAARETATKSLYSQADGLPVDATQLTDLMKRPSMQQAVKRAQQLASEAGESIDVQNMTGRGAHYIKMAMDDLSNASPATGIGGNELRAIQGTRNEFLGNLESQLPVYGQARDAYAKMSRPLNQADIVEEISKKATNFRGDITPAAYARALNDKTAQKVTGQAGAKLSRVMEPDQMSTLNAIKDDLLRQDFSQTAGKSGSDTVQKMAYSNILNAAGVPSAVRNFGPAGVVGNVMERAGQVVYKDANEKLAERLAQALLNPQDAAGLLESSAGSQQMQALVNALKRGGTAVGASAPGVIQARQQ